jgi:putative protease
MEEKEIGIVTHYFGHLSVGIIKLKDSLKVGDTIRFKGHTSDFEQAVESLQIEHKDVQEANAGDMVGLKVKEHVREHDVVYKIIK